MAEVENSKPVKDTYQFGSLSGCLERAGKYTVVYTMLPSRPTLGVLSASVELHASAGPPVQMSVQVKLSNRFASTRLAAALDVQTLKHCSKALVRADQA